MLDTGTLVSTRGVFTFFLFFCLHRGVLVPSFPRVGPDRAGSLVRARALTEHKSMPSRGHGATLALLCAASTLERVACTSNDAASSTAASTTADVLTTRVSDAPSIELLSSDVDVMNAVAFGSLAPVQEWLDGGGNVELRGHKHNFTLLHIACENRQLAMIELLLDRGAGEADLNPHPRPHP